jgi:hypothetical protein
MDSGESCNGYPSRATDYPSPNQASQVHFLAIAAVIRRGYPIPPQADSKLAL